MTGLEHPLGCACGECDDEAARVLAWRLEQFLALQFDVRTAENLASDQTVDVEIARQLVKNGCPLGRAKEILV